jgi:hypothetical protein
MQAPGALPWGLVSQGPEGEGGDADCYRVQLIIKTLLYGEHEQFW